jgi:hypothetical protein
MNGIILTATDRTPAVHFDFDENVYRLSGECFPEDTNAFFGPVIDQLERHLAGLSGAAVEFTFALIYFNSSSAKVVMELFDLLDATAARNNRVTIVWAYEEEDDSVLEIGEEFGEDLVNATFVLKEVPL